VAGRIDDETPARPAPSWIPWALGIYLLVCAAAFVYLLVDVWTGTFDIYRTLFPLDHTSPAQLESIKPLSYTIAGGGIGAVLISMQGLHQYAGVTRTFQASFSGSYLLGPWAATMLALAAYALIKGGILVFGGGGDEGAASNFAYLALGILTGYGWSNVLRRMSTAAGELFGGGASRGDDASPPPSPTPPVTTPAIQPPDAEPPASLGHRP
jgi:hypothetical protein